MARKKTVDNYISDCIKAKRYGDKASGYWDVYRAQWQSEIGQMRLSKLTQKKLQEVVNAEMAGLAPKTVRNAKTVLTSLLEVAVEDGLLPCSPARGLGLPKAATPADSVVEPYSDTVVPTLNKEDRKRIVENLRAHHNQAALAVEIGLVSGMTLAEACGLQYGDFDPEMQTLVVSRRVRRITMPEKGTQLVIKPVVPARSVQIGKRLAARLEHYRKDASLRRGDPVAATDPIFCTIDGKLLDPDIFRQECRHACARCGFFNAGYHDLLPAKENK